MGALQSTEDQLNNVFKGLPPLPADARKSLVNAWPWLALIFGVLQLAAAWALWRATRVVDVIGDYVNTLSLALTGQETGLSSTDKTVMYLGIGLLVVDAVILLMAFPELQKRTARGWRLLFVGSLLNVAYAVLQLFITGHGVGNFLFSLLGSAVGFYLLFQVREYYK